MAAALNKIADSEIDARPALEVLHVRVRVCKYLFWYTCLSIHICKWANNNNMTLKENVFEKGKEKATDYSMVVNWWFISLDMFFFHGRSPYKHFAAGAYWRRAHTRAGGSGGICAGKWRRLCKFTSTLYTTVPYLICITRIECFRSKGSTASRGRRGYTLKQCQAARAWGCFTRSALQEQRLFSIRVWSYPSADGCFFFSGFFSGPFSMNRLGK